MRPRCGTRLPLACVAPAAFLGSAPESPDPATIPSTDLVGVTVTLITCCYKGKEFIRVGYYVNNEHNDPAVNAEIQVLDRWQAWEGGVGKGVP